MKSLSTPGRLLAVWSLLAALSLAPGAEIIDKVVAVVGNRAITSSEVDQQIRLQSFSNVERADLSRQERSEALGRLIERQLVLQEVAVGSFLDSEEKQVMQQLERLRQRRFLDGLSFSKALEVYELKEQDVRAFLQETNSFLRFIDFRFRTGVVVTRQEVEAYYNSVYLPEHRRANASEPLPPAKVYQRIEEILLEQRASRAMDSWLREVRARTRVEILDETLRPGGE